MSAHTSWAHAHEPQSKHISLGLDAAAQMIGNTDMSRHRRRLTVERNVIDICLSCSSQTNSISPRVLRERIQSDARVAYTGFESESQMGPSSLPNEFHLEVSRRSGVFGILPIGRWSNCRWTGLSLGRLKTRMLTVINRE
jgi:hypothetical protein